MNWHRFIFSEQKFHRLRRHAIFWLLWWVYFTASYYHYEQSGLQKIEFEPWNFPFFIKSILLLSVHIIACYYFINFLMPKYLFREKYSSLTAHTLALGGLIMLASYFLHKGVFPLINNAFNYHLAASQNIIWTSVTSGILSAPKIISAAVAVKLLKRWYLKQKEKERLEQEKLVTDLQLLKAQIHPDLLFSSLDIICFLAQKKDVNRASVLLLKLADMLSYILYDCDNTLVPLEKEIKIIRDYVVLQKITLDNQLEIDIAEKGDTSHQVISPLLLLPFIENSFAYFGNKKLETNWINLQFEAKDTVFTMKVIHGKSADSVVVAENRNAIANVTKRLDFFYHDRYRLKTTVEPEIMMTSLEIELDEVIDVNKNSAYTSQQISHATV